MKMKNGIVSEPFYLFQTFNSDEEVKEKVKLNALETRRELVFAKNEKTGVRVVCYGTILALVPSQNEVNNEMTCQWFLLVSKCKCDIYWMVKTDNKIHQCLQTRKIKACTYHFLSK